MLPLNTDRSSFTRPDGYADYSAPIPSSPPVPRLPAPESRSEYPESLGEFLKGPARGEQAEDRSLLGSLLGKAWNGVNSVVGLAWGAIGIPFGARPSFDNNALQFENHPFMDSHGAITLGNVIAYGEKAGPKTPLSKGSPVTVGDHERQHTYQGELLGPLYLPSNILGGVAGLVTEGSWHGEANWNERGPQETPPTDW